MSNYEIISTLITLVAVVISFVAIVRNRKLSAKQLLLENVTIKLNALSTLVSEYKSKAALFEKALVDGTIENENLSRQGMENALAEILDKQYKAVDEIEIILLSTRGSKT